MNTRSNKREEQRERGQGGKQANGNARAKRHKQTTTTTTKKRPWAASCGLHTAQDLEALTESPYFLQTKPNQTTPHPFHKTTGRSRWAEENQSHYFNSGNKRVWGGGRKQTKSWRDSCRHLLVPYTTITRRMCAHACQPSCPPTLFVGPSDNHIAQS